MAVQSQTQLLLAPAAPTASPKSVHSPSSLRSSLSSGVGLPLRAGAISYLEWKNMRFIINDCPSEKNLPDYIREFKKYQVSDVVRVCGPSYSDLLLRAENIEIHDWQYEDGSVPPDHIIANWLNLVRDRFGPAVSPDSAHASPSASPKSISAESVSSSDNNPPKQQTPSIAVHCVAGLGRAPVLVAIALIEYGMGKLDAIEFIRQKRRGAFNVRQIEFLDNYRKQSPNKFKNAFAKIFRLRSSW
eukprot:Partr_v1_DN24612_c0_g1_i1_m59569 putative protein tyrosine phosphatase type IVA